MQTWMRAVALVMLLVVVVALVAITLWNLWETLQLKARMTFTGSTGPRGDTGQKGSNAVLTGATGPTGVAGANGLPGSATLTGATGASGSVGPTGQTGALGPTGLEGFSLDVTGITGGAVIISAFSTAFIADGATGATGDVGPTGATGPMSPSPEQLSWSAGPFTGDTGGSDSTYYMTFGGAPTTVEALGSTLMTMPGTASCLYVGLSAEAATATGVGYHFAALLNGAATPLTVDIVGGNNSGQSCNPVQFVNGDVWSVQVQYDAGSNTGIYALASLSFTPQPT